MNKLNQKGFGALELIAVVIIIVAISVVGWFVYNNSKSQDSSNDVTANNTSASEADVNSNICYIYTPGTLECVNAKNYESKEYPLPSINGSPMSYLVPNKDTSQYATASNATIALLDKKLNITKQYEIPGGLTFNAAALSWSHDNKSLYLELGTVTNNDRHIYKFNLADSSTTKLTVKGSNTMPFQTKDGHILYQYLAPYPESGSTSWQPYIMNADGTNKKAINNIVEGNYYDGAFGGMSYDMATNTVYTDYLETSDSSGGKLLYQTADSIVKGKTPKVTNIKFTASGNHEILRLNDSTIVWVDTPNQETQNGIVLDLNTGKEKHTILKYSNPVGVIKYEF